MSAGVVVYCPCLGKIQFLLTVFPKVPEIVEALPTFPAWNTKSLISKRLKSKMVGNGWNSKNVAKLHEKHDCNSVGPSNQVQRRMPSMTATGQNLYERITRASVKCLFQRKAFSYWLARSFRIRPKSCAVSSWRRYRPVRNAGE